ncbi:MAG: endolytic transglycosylase MltG [Oscillospiraceae bacterium]|nr:endolytic transglycosylase MltG [Oscillospiraceae bacterium]
MNEKKFDKEKKDASGKMNVKMSSETGHAQTPVNNTGKKTGFNGLMYFIFVVSVSVIFACLAWSAATDVLALKSDDVEATVVLAKDSFEYSEVKVKDDDGKETTKKVHTADIGYVADKLKEAGIIKYKWLFKLYCGFSNADEKLDPGTYELKSSYDYRALVMKMQTGSGAMVALKITFPEGYTMHDIFKKLDAEGVCDYDELMDAAANATFNYSFLEGIEKGDASRLEGFLFPDTYEFYEGMPASSAINKLLETFHYKMTAEMLEWQQESGYSMRQIITIASMIEKEASDNADRYKVASVIYNRIKKDWPLQVDATSLYEYPDHEGAPTKDMLQKDSPYNTRINKGLPPTPICSPGIASIKAALKPDKTNYMYYALNSSTGSHEYFTSSSAFEAFVAKQDYD